MEKIALSVSETAEILGISRACAYKLVKNGQLPAIKMGERVLIPSKALRELIDGAQPNSQSSV